MDLLMIIDENKPHYVCIKNLIFNRFNRFTCNKAKNKNKKHFWKLCLQCFSSGRVLIEHKETCLKKHEKQTVKLTSNSIKFKNHFKQLARPFKIYAHFESLLKGVRGSDRNNNTSYTKK